MLGNCDSILDRNADLHCRYSRLINLGPQRNDVAFFLFEVFPVAMSDLRLVFQFFVLLLCLVHEGFRC
jgi:hypothetical protein